MSHLVRSEILDVAYALAVEEFHIFLRIAVKEVVGADTEPEQVDLSVGLAGIVIYFRYVHTGERTV